MITSISVGQGRMVMSDNVSSTGGNVRYISHKDVLEAFSKCHFQSVSQVNSWLLRFRDAHKGISRSFLAKTMLKEHAI